MKTLLSYFLFLLILPAFSAELVLAENGSAKAGIVIPEKAKPIVRFAARELKAHLDAMTGADFPIGTETDKPCSIRLGFGNAEQFAPDEYVICAKGKTIGIHGRDSDAEADLFRFFHDDPYKGTLTGVYGFLDTLGVRWPAPGSSSIPKRKRVAIPEGERHFKPVFRFRQIIGTWDFQSLYPDAGEYVRSVNDIYLWGLRNGVSTRKLVPGGHSERSLGLYKNPERLKNPDSWKLGKNGVRNPNYSCWSSPATKEYFLRAADAYFSGKSPKEAGFDLNGYLDSKWPMPFIVPDEFMIDPMDHYTNEDGRCWCPRCEAFRKKYPCPDDSELMWKMIGEIASEIAVKHPGKYISTLVYPPKREYPKYFPPPANVRVKICMTGPRDCTFPVRFAGDMALLRKWSRLLGRDNIPIWYYQCVSFGRGLPGVPDTYPRLTAAYLKKLEPFCAGMFQENHNLTHTFRNFDVYLFMRMVLDPSRDVEKEIADYFQNYYGPAAREVQTFFARLEHNWSAVDKLARRDVYETVSLGITLENKHEAQKKIWSRVYHQEEMDRLERMLVKAETAASGNDVFLKRVNNLRKWLFDIMKKERAEVMGKEDIRKTFFIRPEKTSAEVFPEAAEWKTAEKYLLSSAEGQKKPLLEGGAFQMLLSSKRLFIRAELSERAMARSATDPAHRSGSRDLWRDNCIELFFQSMETGKFWQIMVNDNNAWTSQTRGRVVPKWIQMPGLSVRTARNTDSWTAEISIPLSELNIGGGELRFNLGRERNIKDRKTELSTWSVLAQLGEWHNPDSYGTIDLK